VRVGRDVLDLTCPVTPETPQILLNRNMFRLSTSNYGGRATEVDLSESLRDRFLTAASSRAAQTVLAENDVGLPFWRLILYAPAASQRE